jgi:hypothetical protein
MIVFGVEASTCGPKCDSVSFRRINEVTDTAIPVGTSTGVADAVGLIRLFR